MNAHTTHPGDAEAAAAIAGMTETYGYQPQIGDCVIVEPPFLLGRRAAIVRQINAAYVLVECDGEHLAYYPHELTFAGKAVPA
jgi:hypothetical protein